MSPTDLTTETSGGHPSPAANATDPRAPSDWARPWLRDFGVIVFVPVVMSGLLVALVLAISGMWHPADPSAMAIGPGLRQLRTYCGPLVDDAAWIFPTAVPILLALFAAVFVLDRPVARDIEQRDRLVLAGRMCAGLLVVYATFTALGAGTRPKDVTGAGLVCLAALGCAGLGAELDRFHTGKPDQRVKDARERKERSEQDLADIREVNIPWKCWVGSALINAVVWWGSLVLLQLPSSLRHGTYAIDDLYTVAIFGDLVLLRFMRTVTKARLSANVILLVFLPVVVIVIEIVEVVEVLHHGLGFAQWRTAVLVAYSVVMALSFLFPKYRRMAGLPRGLRLVRRLPLRTTLEKLTISGLGIAAARGAAQWRHDAAVWDLRAAERLRSRSANGPELPRAAEESPAAAASE